MKTRFTKSNFGDFDQIATLATLRIANLIRLELKRIVQVVKLRITASALSLAVIANAGEPHWAFVKPQPAAADATIDSFIAARLHGENLDPNPPTDPATWFRRLSFDLTGLPPSPEEIDAFVANPDHGSAASRLLESPHFGEKWTRWWLDAAHYADTDGYTVDYERPHAWRYRDWVVEALNANQPFDQFTVEQIAGDLLPNSTTKQKIATGFFRNTLSNREGGADLEEFRVAKIKDRVSTFGATWLGLTIECAECHDHKFDPISQREYFGLYAFFNNADEINVDAPLPGEAEARAAAMAEYQRKRAELIDPIRKELEALMAEWEQRLLESENNPGLDYKRDRSLELLGILWGKGEGEGQLSGLRIVKTPMAERTLEQRQQLLDFFLVRGGLGFSEEFKQLKLGELRKQLDALNADLPKISRPQTLTIALMPRETRIHERGDFRAPTTLVSTGTPAVLHPFGPAKTRLDLGRWVVSPENPLTARVIVNRVWFELFGRGLVETTEDFGLRGQAPSHPQLLDFLAVEFVESGWDLKKLIHSIVTSEAYRRSSAWRTDLASRDPGNRLLARYPRLRLSGELVRDNALAVSGLLDSKIGGPSVRPPQPETVSKEGSYQNKWEVSEGGDRYRRGLYTFLQRTSPYAQFQTFDLPNLNRACTRRGRSNTPLQALTLLNDPVFVEAADALATRMIREIPYGDVRSRIERGFRLCLGRAPDSGELDRLVEFQQASDDDSLTATASVLLNLDEFITKE